MNLSAINLLKTFLIIFILNEKLTVSTILTTNHANLIKRVKKNSENLCPDEYKSCWCDYTNTNLNSNIATGKQNSKTSVSIMIDCQFYNTAQNEDEKKNRTLNAKLIKKTNLYSIPRIASNTSVAKFKYLKQIIHIDLSRTEITEIQTDSFHGLTGLQTIVITYCKNLVRVKMFSFRNLPNLKTLIIANNPNLIELEPHAFGSLKNLNYLSLSMNQLNVIDGHIFSSSTSIKTIDFIGNPIKRIKSFAFHGLRNVSDLLLSLSQNITPIEIIEGDAFISTAFVDQIFLEGIPSKSLPTNAFRGLSYCKSLHLSNTYIEDIESNAFFRANHINRVNLQNSRIRNLNQDAFRGMYNIETIDLRGNYISKLPNTTFEPLISNNINLIKENIINATSSITIIEKNDKYLVGKLLFEQNPIQCDCNLDWIIRNKQYNNFIGLPEICAGPKGYDCLRISELKIETLSCSAKTPIKIPPCQDIEFTIDKILSIDSKKPNIIIPNNNDNAEVEEDLLDEYNDDYYNNNNNKYETTFTQVITPVHIIDIITPNPLKKSLEQKQKPLDSTRRIQVMSSRQQTVNKISLVATTVSKQNNFKFDNRVINQERFDNRSVANLANGVFYSNKFFNTHNFFIYLNSIIMTLFLVVLI